MLRTRRRRLAWMFMLALALELALLCCASAHLADHACSGHSTCAVCAFVRIHLRRAAVLAVAVSALLASAAIHSPARLPRRFTIADSPVLRRVRLND